MDLVGCCGIALLTAIATLLLKELGARDRLAVIAGGVLLFSLLFHRLHEIKEFCNTWLIGGSGEYSTLLLKGLGICLAVEICAGICRECGAELVAKALSMLG